MENKEHSYPERRSVSIITAMSPDRSIGYKGSLPWHIPEDLAHFKALTWGHTIIMGRKTFCSLPNGALPGRRNIVLSRKSDKFMGCEVYHSLSDALAGCWTDEEIFIIGGSSVYQESLPIATKLYVTYIETNPQNADTFFPNIDKKLWKITKKEKHDGFSFLELDRVKL